MIGNLLFMFLGTVAGIIPIPLEYKTLDGVCDLGEEVTVYIQGNDASGTNSFCEYLAECVPFDTKIVEEPDKATVKICIDASLDIPEEGYAMKISTEGIDIQSSTVTGAFYAFMNILQMSGWGQSRQIECCEICDAPQYPYRGLHVDVSRHFRSKEFLMKQMDAMALFKLNKMHLHLTDGAGWRIQIDKYPRLTEYAAWRPQSNWIDWYNMKGGYCDYDTPDAYGGYYTKDDIRGILEYATLRHIEVIPEIEMPGHSSEVLAAYPELCCNNLDGREAVFCPGKEETFIFLENILDEIIDLFPSQYIHIGGDEVNKSAWVNCPECQRRMQEEGLENVEELQSYFVHRIEEYVNSKGRKDVGWDEILYGGMAPNAIIMSWRGTEGGIEAVGLGHDVIMTPDNYCYLDYYQDAPFKEPEALGGFVSLAKIYSFEMSCASSMENPDDWTDEMQSHILGIQGNLWSEYIQDDSHAEYMYYPRALAVAETGWSRPDKKDYENFRNRALDALETLRYMGYTTFNLAEEYGDRPESLVPVDHLAVGCKVDCLTQSPIMRAKKDDSMLTDGLGGGWSYEDDQWHSFFGNMDVIVDLGEVRDIQRIELTFLKSDGIHIFLPDSVEFSISMDGETFETVSVVDCGGDVYPDMLNGKPAGSAVLGYNCIAFFSLYGTDVTASAKFVRVSAACPKSRGRLMTDEIIVK